MGRRAFTLIELLVIIAVIGIMTTTAVLSVVSGQRAVRVKGATRDVFAAIRHARSTALVTQQPAIITYSNETVDGEPVVTANGVLAAGSTVNGAWYRLAAANRTALATVQIIGSTSIDDVLVAEAAAVADVLPTLQDAAGTTAGVPNSWIEQQGITRAAAAGDAPDNSGMTVAGKYAAGFDVGDGKKFGVKTMTLADVNGTPTATITFDAATALKAGYSYVLSTSTDNSSWSDATTISAADVAAGSTSIALDAPVKYLKLKVVNN